MDIQKILGTRKVSLSQMLDARERRAARQKEMLALMCPCLVSFTLNMPGEFKRFPLAERFFLRGVVKLERALAQAGMDVKKKAAFIEDTGCEAFFAVDSDPLAVKRATSSIEEGSAASRLYDMDVLDASGRKVSREEIGLPARRCIICGRPVMECGPRRRHSAEEIAAAAVRLMLDDEAGQPGAKPEEVAQGADFCEWQKGENGNVHSWSVCRAASADHHA